MQVILGLLSALSYGVSDFAAGVASRRTEAAHVGVLTGIVATVVAAAAAAVVGEAATNAALGWGAVAGLGSAVGTLALFQGLAVGRMAVVMPVSAVVAAAVPVAVGLAMGETLSGTAVVGIAIGLPAIALVASSGGRVATSVSAKPDVLYGVAAGLGFALIFIALGAAEGTSTWPVVVSYVTSTIALALLAFARTRRVLPRGVFWLSSVAGVCGGGATTLFRLAAAAGPVSLASVLVSLYPAATVILAAVFLRERVNRAGAVGLAMAVVAVALISR